MSQLFAAGDNLVFQLESGFGILRILAIDELAGGDCVWHLSVAEDFYPDVESAEAALEHDAPLPVRVPHLALSTYALEKTPAARLSNTPVRDEELRAYHDWQQRGGEVSNRSVLLMLGFR